MTDPRPPRLLAPDLSRGIMLLLIAMAYAGVYVGAPFGTVVTDLPALDRATALLTTVFLDNRSFPMFAILFGYGLAWSVSRRQERGIPEMEIRRRNRRRGLCLLGLGALHAFLVYPGEILTSYGLAVLLIGGLLFAPARTVRRAAVGFAAAYALLVPLLAIAMAWASQYAAPADDAAGSTLPGYASTGEWIIRLLQLPITPLFLALAYPLLLLVTLGFLAGRARLLDDPGAHRRALRALAGGGIAISVLGAMPSALVAVGVFEAGPVALGLLHGLQILSGVVGGAGYAALFALVAARLQDRQGQLVRAVAAVGKRSLTVYLGSSVLVAVILHLDLLGLGAHVGPFGAVVTAAAVWTAALLGCAWLERRRLPGPLETLMGRLVDGASAQRVGTQSVSATLEGR